MDPPGDKLRPRIALLLANVGPPKSRNPFRGNGGFGTGFAVAEPDSPASVSDAIDLAKDEKHILSSAANLAEMAEGIKGVLSSSGSIGTYLLTQPPAATVHLDAGYMLAQASSNFLDIGLDALDGFVKVLAQWFIDAARTPRFPNVEPTLEETEQKENALAKMLAGHEPLKLVRLWFTASSIPEAVRLMGHIKATIGIPAYQLDDKRQVYLVGEFA